MKKATILFLALLAVGSTNLLAQQTEAPKTGAKIYIENKGLAIPANGEHTFDVYIVRSKRAGKTTFELPTFSGADNVTFEVIQDEANPDHYVVTAKSEKALTGTLFYTITSRSNSGTQQISGTTISVNAKGTSAVASIDDN